MVLSTGVIMLLFTFLIGRVEITPECCPLLEQSMKTSFIIFAALCLGGMFASLAKGKVCWSPLPVHFADDLNLSYEIP